MDLMKYFNHLFLSVSENVKQRVSSPVGGAFLLSWLIINWKFLYIFFRDDSSVQQKVELLNSTYVNWCNSLLFPMFAALAYIFLYPIIINVSHLIWAFADNRSKKFTSFFFKNYVPISKKESDTLYDLLESDREKHERKVSELEIQNTALKKLIGHKKKSDNIEGDQQPVDNSIQFDRNLVTLLNTEAGKYIFNKSIAKKLHKSVDHPSHKIEIDLYANLLRSIISSFPKEYTPIAIRSNDRSIAIPEVIGYLKTLENMDIISSLTAGNKTTYSFTNTGIQYITETAEQIDATE